MIELYQHQKDVLTLLEPYNKCAMYLEAGTGKTFTSIAKALTYDAPILVVCPKAVIPQWIRAFKDMGEEAKDWTKPKQFGTGDVAVITYGLAWRRDIKLKDFTLILDESHNICNPTSKQTKGVMKLKYKNLILLSGTPNGGRYDKLYTQMKMLGYKPTKRQFEDRYCNMFDMETGGVKFRVLSKTNPYKNVDELKCILTDELHCVFMKTNDVISLPEQHFINIDIPVSTDYKKFLKDEYIDLGDREYIADSPTNKLLYSRYLCGFENKNKLDVLTTLIEGIGDRLIIFYNFENERSVLTNLCKKLKRRVFVCNGSVKQVDDFKRNEESILLVQYQAGATGLNLQFCNKVVYFSPTLSSTLYEQSKARTWRTGQKNKCTYWLLTCGVEYDIMKSLNQKNDFTLKLFKG